LLGLKYRFCVVYDLLSFFNNLKIHVKINVKIHVKIYVNAVIFIKSVVGLFHSANW